jgi:hypothetical protein
MATNKIASSAQGILEDLYNNKTFNKVITALSPQKLSKYNDFNLRRMFCDYNGLGIDQDIDELKDKALISLIIYDKDDPLSVSALDDCMGNFFQNNAHSDRLTLYVDFNNARPGIPQLPKPDNDRNKDFIRRHFFANYVFVPTSINTTSFVQRNTYDILAKWILIRLNNCVQYQKKNPNGNFQGLITFIVKAEITSISEDEVDRTRRPVFIRCFKLLEGSST